MMSESCVQHKAKAGETRTVTIQNIYLANGAAMPFHGLNPLRHPDQIYTRQMGPLCHSVA